jgi:hypothetical protein
MGIRVAIGGVLVLSALVLVILDLRAEWSCRTGGPQEALTIAAALVTACAVLVLAWPPRRWRWLYAVGSGVVVFVVLATEAIYESLQNCSS